LRTIKYNFLRFFKAEKPGVVAGQVLIEDEKMEVGGVKWSIYRYYGKSVGVGWTINCLLLFLVSMLLNFLRP
jgi:hypothetical protein